jgi:hypothetical protein
MIDPRYPELYERDEVRKSKRGIIEYWLDTMLGTVLPVRHTGKLYLMRELQKCSINTSIIPEACLQDLTDEAIRQCKDQSRFEGRWWRSTITQHIEEIAFLIACRLDGDNIYMAAMRRPDPFVDILRKHSLLPDAQGMPPERGKP